MRFGIVALQVTAYVENSSYAPKYSGGGSTIRWRKFLNWRTYDAFLNDFSRGTRRKMSGIADHFRRTETAPIESENLDLGLLKSELLLHNPKSHKLMQNSPYDATQRSRAKPNTENSRIRKNPDIWLQMGQQVQSPYRQKWVAEDSARSRNRDLTSDNQSFVDQSGKASSSRSPVNITAGGSGDVKVDTSTGHDVPTSEKESSALATPTDGTTAPLRLSKEIQSPDDVSNVVDPQSNNNGWTSILPNPILGRDSGPR